MSLSHSADRCQLAHQKFEDSRFTSTVFTNLTVNTTRRQDDPVWIWIIQLKGLVLKGLLSGAIKRRLFPDEQMLLMTRTMQMRDSRSADRLSPEKSRWSAE